MVEEEDEEQDDNYPCPMIDGIRIQIHTFLRASHGGGGDGDDVLHGVSSCAMGLVQELEWVWVVYMEILDTNHTCGFFCQEITWNIILVHIKTDINRHGPKNIGKNTNLMRYQAAAVIGPGETTPWN